jgi:hypothetical protein
VCIDHIYPSEYSSTDERDLEVPEMQYEGHIDPRLGSPRNQILFLALEQAGLVKFSFVSYFNIFVCKIQSARG